MSDKCPKCHHANHHFTSCTCMINNHHNKCNCVLNHNYVKDGKECHRHNVCGQFVKTFDIDKKTKERVYKRCGCSSCHCKRCQLIIKCGCNAWCRCDDCQEKRNKSRSVSAALSGLCVASCGVQSYLLISTFMDLGYGGDGFHTVVKCTALFYSTLTPFFTGMAGFSTYGCCYRQYTYQTPSRCCISTNFILMNLLVTPSGLFIAWFNMTKTVGPIFWILLSLNLTTGMMAYTCGYYHYFNDSKPAETANSDWDNVSIPEISKRFRWKQTAILAAFLRANKDSPIKDSIIDLMPQLLGIKKDLFQHYHYNTSKLMNSVYVSNLVGKNDVTCDVAKLS